MGREEVFPKSPQNAKEIPRETGEEEKGDPQRNLGFTDGWEDAETTSKLRLRMVGRVQGSGGMMLGLGYEDMS
jgi:hypothetical protein